jgi:saccharopine dehydrogenase (NAD+, L-lysine-forming)
MGQLIAAELADRAMSIGLAGREPEPLTQQARRLSAQGARTEVHPVDLTDPAALMEAAAHARVVLSTIGPFSRWADPVVEACLTVHVSYVDIANEWPAMRQLLDRDGQARERGITFVSGAGFGVSATETLVLRLLGDNSVTPARVRVAGAPAVATRSEGVASTIREAMNQGAVTYRDGQIVREPLGTGATVLSFGGAQRRVFPGPVADLEAARMASGAPDVLAYVPEPSERGAESASYAWAEVTWPDGRVDTAELQLGDGNRATAAIAAETTARVLARNGSGAWTPCRRFGAALVTEATDARVAVNGTAA